MSQNFLFPQRDQPLLLPVDMREWLPEDDLVFVVLEAVRLSAGQPTVPASIVTMRLAGPISVRLPERP